MSVGSRMGTCQTPILTIEIASYSQLAMRSKIPFSNIAVRFVDS